MTHTVLDDPAHDHDASDEGDMLDEEWIAAPKRRSRVRIVLVGALAAALCFLGGAYVQKQYGAADAEPTAGPGGFGAGGLPEGLELPEGMELPEGFPAGGGFPGLGQGSTGSVESPDGTGDDDNAKAVIGTVIEIRGELWIVEDLGGNRHEIKVTSETDLVRESRLEPDEVKVGDRVDVAGTSSDDGQIQGDEVTLR